MLADPRSQALVKNFAGQWLFLRNIPDMQPDPAAFPNFDENLRQAMRQETELLARKHAARGSQRRRSARRRITPSSISAWPSITAFRASTATSSAASL